MNIYLRCSIVALTLLSGCSAGSDSLELEEAEPEEVELGQLGSALTATVTCTIQTSNGRYVTAVGGGGRITDVIHTDATRALGWEKFKLVDSGDGSSFINYGFQTATGNFLTAVGGGGRITDVIHSDAKRLLAWEKFTPISLGGGLYAIRTIDGHYLTAISGGGRITDTVHSDALAIGAWEKFRLDCTGV